MKFLKVLGIFLAISVMSMMSLPVVAQDVPVMSERLHWSAPTEYTDGSPILEGELVNYTVLCGLEEGSSEMTANVPASVTQYTRAQMLETFEMAYSTVYFCAVTVTATNGGTSARSQTVGFTIEDRRIPGAPGLSVQ